MRKRASLRIFWQSGSQGSSPSRQQAWSSIYRRRDAVYYQKVGGLLSGYGALIYDRVRISQKKMCFDVELTRFNVELIDFNVELIDIYTLS